MKRSAADKETIFDFLKKHRPVIFLVFILLLAGIMSLPQVQRFAFFKDLEDATLSLRLRMRGIQEPSHDEVPIVIVALDDTSLYTQLNEADLAANPDAIWTQEPWPWNRSIHAALMRKLFAAGARVVAFDFVFPTPNDGALAFYDTLDAFQERVVIGFDYSPYENELGETRIDERLPYDDLLPLEGSIETIGFVNVARDPDGTLRRAKLSTNIYAENQLFADNIEQHARIAALAQRSERELSFSARIASKVDPTTVDDLPDFFDMPMINFGGPASYFPSISYLDVILEDRFTRFQDLVDGAIVIVGPYSDLFKDVIATPFGDMFGVETHAHVVRSILTDSFVMEPPTGTETGLNLLCALPVLAIGLGIRSAYLKVALAGGLALLFVAGVQIAFESSYLINPVVPCLITILLGSGTLTAYDFVLEQFDRNRLKGYLSRYVSPEVANILASNRDEFKALLQGTSRPMTILFSDIRGFTTLSERYSPKGLVEHLNDYFEGMVSEILKTRGSLNKYIGDAILAVWGDIYSEGDKADCLRAVTCAMSMKEVMAELNKSWEGQEGRLPMAIGIGISQGEGFIGNMGHQSRMEVAVMGDVVNLGSRLEGATKQYQTDILVSESVYDLCKDTFRFQELDVIQVKGKTEGIRVFAPINRLDEREPEWFVEWGLALNSYRDRRFPQAAVLFDKLSKTHPKIAGAANLYVERARELDHNPPPENWDFVFVMETK